MFYLAPSRHQEWHHGSFCSNQSTSLLLPTGKAAEACQLATEIFIVFGA